MTKNSWNFLELVESMRNMSDHCKFCQTTGWQWEPAESWGLVEPQNSGTLIGASKFNLPSGDKVRFQDSFTRSSKRGRLSLVQCFWVTELESVEVGVSGCHWKKKQWVGPGHRSTCSAHVVFFGKQPVTQEKTRCRSENRKLIRPAVRECNFNVDMNYVGSSSPSQ